MIDFRPVFKLLDDFGYKGWMVVEAEQDPALANPFEYAVKARKYIRETAGSNRCDIFRPYRVWPAFSFLNRTQGLTTAPDSSLPQGEGRGEDDDDG